MYMLGYGLRKARVCALQQATDGMVWVDGWTRGMGGWVDQRNGWMGGLEEWVDGWIGYGWVSGMGGLVEWVDGLFIHGYRNGKVVQ